MSKKQALQAIADELHLSHSQMFTYLTCSLKYRFQYIERRRSERISIALPFGSAIHTAIERFYRGIKDKGGLEPLNTIQELFEDSLRVDLDHTDIPILFKKGVLTPQISRAVFCVGCICMVAFINLVLARNKCQNVHWLHHI